MGTPVNFSNGVQSIASLPQDIDQNSGPGIVNCDKVLSSQVISNSVSVNNAFNYTPDQNSASGIAFIPPQIVKTFSKSDLLTLNSSPLTVANSLAVRNMFCVLSAVMILSSGGIPYSITGTPVFKFKVGNTQIGSDIPVSGFLVSSSLRTVIDIGNMRINNGSYFASEDLESLPLTLSMSGGTIQNTTSGNNQLIIQMFVNIYNTDRKS